MSRCCPNFCAVFYRETVGHFMKKYMCLNSLPDIIYNCSCYPEAMVIKKTYVAWSTSSKQPDWLLQFDQRF